MPFRAVIEANLESLRILEEIRANDPSYFEFLKQTHLTYNNTDDILLEQGKLSEALSCYRKGMDYAARMSALNDSSQIAVLRSESSRKIGEAHLAIANRTKVARVRLLAREHLARAREDLLALRRRDELGKNYEHKLEAIEKLLATQF